MIDRDVVSLADQRIKLEICEQQKTLERDIQSHRGLMNSRGMLNSGNTAAGIAELCAAAARERGQFAWKILHRFVTTGGVSHSESLADELKKVVISYLPEELGDLKGIARTSSSNLASASVATQLVAIVEDARAATVARLFSEIDLFVLSLKSHPALGPVTGQVNNFYSPVGAFQTGPNANAHVTQHIDSEIKQQIMEALAAIQADLAGVKGMHVSEMAEIERAVNEAQAEIARPMPSGSKLRKLLTGISTMIATIGAVKNAYELVKAAIEALSG